MNHHHRNYFQKCSKCSQILVKEKIESSRMFYLLKTKIDESSSQELFSKMFKMFKKKLKKQLLKENKIESLQIFYLSK
jgi:hypothetical protein